MHRQFKRLEARDVCHVITAELCFEELAFIHQDSFFLTLNKSHQL